jgi:toxin-antitoxin system PIN domain toxin
VTFLLDVNVLIGLIDPGHVTHEDAHRWFRSTGQSSWATCPITENGVMRIVGNPRYPNSPGSPAIVADIVRELRGLPGHSFWADDVSLVVDHEIDRTKILTTTQVTDAYLLALAHKRGGQLATFDRKLSGTMVRGGNAALCLIPVE